MEKKYIVRLSQEERDHLNEVIKKLAGSSQKVRRAQILLKADANGPDWTDAKIAEAFSCRTKTVENIRQRLVMLQSNLTGKPDAGNLHVRFDEGECREWPYRRLAFSTLP